MSEPISATMPGEFTAGEFLAWVGSLAAHGHHVAAVCCECSAIWCQECSGPTCSACGDAAFDRLTNMVDALVTVAGMAATIGEHP